MGRMKTGASLAAGFILIGSMLLNAAAREVSGAGTALLLLGLALICLPFDPPVPRWSCPARASRATGRAICSKAG